MAMNLGLFFKLWAMEDIAHRMYLTTKHRLRERTEARSDNFQLLCTLISLICVGRPEKVVMSAQSRSLGVGGEMEGGQSPSSERLFGYLAMLQTPVQERL